MNIGLIITIIFIILIAIIAVVFLTPIRGWIKTRLTKDEYETLLFLAEMSVRWAKQWMQTATGEEKKAEVCGYLLKKCAALGLTVDEDDIDKAIEAVYEKIKDETEPQLTDAEVANGIL